MIRLHHVATPAQFFALVVTLVVALVATDADATRLKVRGTTRISARATRGKEERATPPTPTLAPAPTPPAPTAATRVLFVEGTVEDDVGTRLVGEPVELRAFSAIQGRGLRFDDATSATSCDPITSPLGRQGDAVVTTSDGSGRFCARLTLPVERYVFKLTTSGGPLMDPGAAELAVDLGRRSVSIRFDGASYRVSLDRGAHTIVGVASFDDDNVRVVAEQIPLTLSTGTSTGTGTIVGNEVTGTGGRATFQVRSESLGGPGLGELRLAFPGDEEAAASSATMAIEKRAKVTLSLAKPIESTSAPEDGVPISVLVTTRTQAVPTGVIEARVGETVVGAAPVREGHADFSATFAAASDVKEVALSIRFLPEAPWWDAPDALTARVPLSGIPAWRKVSLVLAGILVAVFIVLGRVGRVRSVPRAPKSILRGGPSAPREGVAVLEVAQDARSGWTGRIIDAHDRSVVAGARVLIESADFQGTQVLASAFADDVGAFTLPRVSIRARAELVVDAPLHTSLRKALPAAGVLEVALVSRKRALLERLVEWARLRGKPFDARPEPTPAHVRRAAVQDSPPARWAAAIESAAFGPDPVDGRVEAEVDALRPEVAPKALVLPVGQTKER